MGLPLSCCGDTECALFAVEDEKGLEGTGCERSITILNTGALGVGVAVLVTVAGGIVLRKSCSSTFDMHSKHKLSTCVCLDLCYSLYRRCT